jgi:hypothetical protein
MPHPAAGLIGTYRIVLEHLDPDGETASQSPGQEAAWLVTASASSSSSLTPASGARLATAGRQAGTNCLILVGNQILYACVSS